MHEQRDADRRHGGNQNDDAQLAFEREIRKPTNQRAPFAQMVRI
jgi:hypothetical protein